MTPVPYLQGFYYLAGDVPLNCWIEYESGDKSTGQNAMAYLAVAIVGDSGIDILDLLDSAIIERIETAAVEYFSEGEMQ